MPSEEYKPLPSEERPWTPERLEVTAELMKKGAEWYQGPKGEQVLFVPRDVQLEIIREHEGLAEVERVHARENVLVPWYKEEFGKREEIKTPYFTVLKDVERTIDRFEDALRVSGIRSDRKAIAEGYGSEHRVTTVRDSFLKDLESFEIWGVIPSEEKARLSEGIKDEWVFERDGSPRYHSEAYSDLYRRMGDYRSKTRQVIAVSEARELGLLKGISPRLTQEKMVAMIVNDELSPGLEAFLTEVTLFRLAELYMGEERRIEVLEQMRKGKPLDSSFIHLATGQLNHLANEWINPSKPEEGS